MSIKVQHNLPVVPKPGDRLEHEYLGLSAATTFYGP